MRVWAVVAACALAAAARGGRRRARLDDLFADRHGVTSQTIDEAVAMLRDGGDASSLVQVHADVDVFMGIQKSQSLQRLLGEDGGEMAYADAVNMKMVYGEAATLPDGRRLHLQRPSSSGGHGGGHNHHANGGSALGVPLMGVVYDGTLYASNRSHHCVPSAAGGACPAGTVTCTIGGEAGLCFASERDAAQQAAEETRAGHAAAMEVYGVDAVAARIKRQREREAGRDQQHVRRGRHATAAAARRLGEQAAPVSRSRGVRTMLAVRVKFANQSDASAVSAASLLSDARTLAVLGASRSFGTLAWNVTVPHGCIYE